MIEIYFDLTKGDMKGGFMNAGDQQSPMGNLGKFIRYSIECSSGGEL